MSTALPSRGGSDKIFIEDLRFYGYHGVSRAQQAVGTWFSVDLELALDLTPAALSDDLGATVDYTEVARRVVEIGTKERVNLLERLAALVAETLLREFPAQAIRVRIKKLTPPMEGLHAFPGVELVRQR
ncbi:MAG: dihydroneopterin aldolase [Candidatus Methylomirabilia bacterium]